MLNFSLEATSDNIALVSMFNFLFDLMIISYPSDPRRPADSGNIIRRFFLPDWASFDNFFKQSHCSV
jgi:hypothetical protein